MSSAQEWAARHLRFWEAVNKAGQEAEATEAGAARGMTITLSRQMGSGGEEIGQGVARELGYEYCDREIVDYMATHARVRHHLVASLDERTRSAFEDWLTNLLSQHPFDQTAYLRHLAYVIASIAARGQTVIVGRGAHLLVRPPFVYRCRIVAPLHRRIERVARETGLSLDQARRKVEETDGHRDAFIREAFNRDPHDPSEYDLTLNTAEMGVEEAVQIICAGVRARVAALAVTGKKRSP